MTSSTQGNSLDGELSNLVHPCRHRVVDRACRQTLHVGVNAPLQYVFLLDDGFVRYLGYKIVDVTRDNDGFRLIAKGPYARDGKAHVWRLELGYNGFIHGGTKCTS